MSNLYLIVTAGQGDIDYKLIDKESWDWIMSAPPTELYSSSTCSIDDTSCPAAIRQELYQQEIAWDPNSKFEDFEVTITTGSPENDKALLAPGICDEMFHTALDVTKWAAQNGHIIVEEWNGHIY